MISKSKTVTHTRVTNIEVYRFFGLQPTVVHISDEAGGLAIFMEGWSGEQ